MNNRLEIMRNILTEFHLAPMISRTPDELADALDEDILNIRPQVTKLTKSGYLAKTSQMGFTKLHARCHYWAITLKGLSIQPRDLDANCIHTA
jgi:hypothetical protein